MIDLTKLKDILESLSYLAILLGIPIGIYQYRSAKRKEQLDREYGTYNALDEKFIEFQNLCLQFPHLDIFDIPDSTFSGPNSVKKKQELIAFTILFAIFERAYLMYRDQSTEIKEKQWVGWNKYIGEFFERENFQSAWLISGETFDADYQTYMKKKMQSYMRKKRRKEKMQKKKNAELR